MASREGTAVLILQKRKRKPEKIPYPRSHPQCIWQVCSGGHLEQWEPPEDRTNRTTAGFAGNCSHCLGLACLTLRKSFLSLQLGFLPLTSATESEPEMAAGGRGNLPQFSEVSPRPWPSEDSDFSAVNSSSSPAGDGSCSKEEVQLRQCTPLPSGKIRSSLAFSGHSPGVSDLTPPGLGTGQKCWPRATSALPASRALMSRVSVPGKAASHLQMALSQSRKYSLVLLARKCFCLF